MNLGSVIRILSGGVIFLPRLHVDRPVIVCVTLFLALKRRLHQTEVDGHQFVIIIMGVCNAGAAVTQPKASQPRRQVTREGSSAALADDWTVGSMNLKPPAQ